MVRANVQVRMMNKERAAAVTLSCGWTISSIRATAPSIGHDGGNDLCVLRLIDITDPFPKFGDRVGREYQSFTSGLAKVSASRAVRRILVVHMGVKLPG